MTAIALVDDVCEILTASGIQWAFLRDAETLVQAKRPGDDIDIWIARQSLETGIRALVDAGYLPASGRVFWGCGQSPAQVIRFRNDKFSGIDFEVWSGGLRAGPFVYLTDESLVAGFCTERDYPVPSKAILQIILTNRLLLAGRLDDDRATKARTHFESCDDYARDQWREITIVYLGERCHVRIEGALLGRNSFPSRGFVLRSYFARQPSLIISTLRTVIDAGSTRLVSVVRGKGRSVAFIGTDGTGKSTFARTGANSLASWGVSCSVDYMGRSRGQISAIAAVRERVLRSASPGKPMGNQPGLLVRLGAIAYLMDYWLRFLGLVWPRQLAGRWTLIDRGPADLIVMRVSRRFRALAYLAPRPSASIFCFADAHTILARKQERSLSEIEWQQQEYRTYFEKLRGRMPVLFLNTAHSVDDVKARLSAVLSSECGRGRGIMGSYLCRLVTDALSD